MINLKKVKNCECLTKIYQSHRETGCHECKMFKKVLKTSKQSMLDFSYERVWIIQVPFNTVIPLNFFRFFFVYFSFSLIKNKKVVTNLESF